MPDPDLTDGKVHVIVGRPRRSKRKARRIYPTKNRKGVTLRESQSAPMKSWETWELPIVRDWAGRRDWMTWEQHPGGFDITPGVVGKEYKVDRALLAALNALAKHGNLVVEIHSGWRSYAKQMQLWLLHLAGRGAPANRPGSSKHETNPATAVDARIRGQNFWEYVNARPALREKAKHLGLVQPYQHESWHVELR